MEIDIIFKIAAIGILTAVISQILQHQGKSEIATLATLAGLVVTLVMVLNMISGLFDMIKSLFNLY
ncbi:MAG: stage III sporulation protein AC [Clostridia bacterium]|nr:stage III sporulation protein AC [Clostridia bacterium]